MVIHLGTLIFTGSLIYRGTHIGIPLYGGTAIYKRTPIYRVKFWEAAPPGIFGEAGPPKFDDL